jgi:hypothetical protein
VTTPVRLSTIESLTIFQTPALVTGPGRDRRVSDAIVSLHQLRIYRERTEIQDLLPAEGRVACPDQPDTGPAAALSGLATFHRLADITSRQAPPACEKRDPQDREPPLPVGPPAPRPRLSPCPTNTALASQPPVNKESDAVGSWRTLVKTLVKIRSENLRTSLAYLATASSVYTDNGPNNLHPPANLYAKMARRTLNHRCGRAEETERPPSCEALPVAEPPDNHDGPE